MCENINLTNLSSNRKTTWSWTDFLICSKNSLLSFRSFCYSILFAFFSRLFFFFSSFDWCWHEFVSPHETLTIHIETRLLAIRAHLINFSIFYNLLSISILLHIQYVSMFWLLIRFSSAWELSSRLLLALFAHRITSPAVKKIESKQTNNLK